MTETPSESESVEEEPKFVKHPNWKVLYPEVDALLRDWMFLHPNKEKEKEASNG